MAIKAYGSMTITDVSDGASIKKINAKLRIQPLSTWTDDYAKRATIKWDALEGEDNSHILVGDLAYIVGIGTTDNGNVDVSFYGIVTNVDSSGVTMTPSHLITSGENGTDGRGIDDEIILYFSGYSGSHEPGERLFPYWACRCPFNQYGHKIRRSE